ncbi:MAG: tripartite tricarboxylate transporter substrate binding protein [Betaproteobacteria bacterium]|nr:tripartite tricarboxylate transporter substrate binding protein [Betaproteobacteria bacterium]
MRVLTQVRAGLLCVLLGLSCVVLAQSYPSKPVRLIIDTAPGGITDILGRLSADSLTLQTGRQVVVENRVGGLGFVALEAFAKAPNDGYTLMVVGSGTIVLQPLLQRNISYDPVNDFQPVFNIAETPHILVVPANLPANNVAEFIAYVKANPGRINYGSAGVGGPPHLALDRFARITGLQMTHIPYKGVGGTMADLVAGRIQVVSMSVGSARPNLKSGALKALVTGAKTRLAALPDVPTSAETGIPEWEMSAWFGIYAPKGSSGEIVRFINGKLQTWLDDPKTRSRFVDLGAEPLGGSSASFIERVYADFKYWGQVVRDSGIKLE